MIKKILHTLKNIRNIFLAALSIKLCVLMINLDLRLTKNVPIICHNLKGYDSHLIIKKIGNVD